MVGQAPKPKGRKGRGQSAAVVDGLSTEDMSKDQLEEHILRLLEELDREREERSYFQLERDKIQAFWEVSRRSVEEVQAALRTRSREREEAEERHRVEISVYKQKLKHLLAEHHSTVSELKVDAVTSSSLAKNRNTESELSLRRDVQDQQGALTEKKLHIESCLKELKLKHQVDLMELTNEYERRITEMEVKHHQKMRLLVEAEEKKRRQEVEEVEERMRSHVEDLKEEQERARRGAEEFYSGVHTKLLTEQKQLKEQLQGALLLQERADRKLSATLQENQHLTETLTDAQLKHNQLHTQLEQHNRNKAAEVRSRARLKLIEEELRDLKVEHELLLQAFNKVEEERDTLLRTQTEEVLELQQRSRRKEVLLLRRVEALSRTLHQQQEQLGTALGSCRATTHTHTHTLQEAQQEPAELLSTVTS